MRGKDSNRGLIAIANNPLLAGTYAPVRPTHQKVRLADLERNPFRDLKVHGLEPARIDRLKASIRETGFWANMQAREHPTHAGKFQIANGHHRVAAAIAVLGKTYRQSVEIIECGDLEMLQRMAAENAEEFGAMPAHLVQCVEQAVALLGKMFEAVPTLGQPSKAKTARGQRKARSGTQSGKSTSLSSPSPRDVATLRRLYGGENNYQKARQAGRPGAPVLVEFLRGAFDQNAVRTALRAYEAALKAGVPVTTLVDTVENVHQLDQVSKVLTSDATKHLSAAGISETLRRMHAQLAEAKESGRPRPKGAKLLTTGLRTIAELAHEANNPEAEKAARVDELHQFLDRLKPEWRRMVQQFECLLELAHEARLTALTDPALFGGFYQIQLQLFTVLTRFYESDLASPDTVTRKAMSMEAARLHKALQDDDGPRMQ